jgi:hypothetical protein
MMVALDFFALVRRLMPADRTGDDKSGQEPGFALVEIAKENLPGITALAEKQKIPGTWCKGAHRGLSVGVKMERSLALSHLNDLPLRRAIVLYIAA